MPKIVITRKNEFINKLKYFDVLVNDKKLGSVKNGSSEEFEVPVGQQQIECKVNWYYSNNYQVDAKDGQTVFLMVKNNATIRLVVLLAIVVTFLVTRLLLMNGTINVELMDKIRIGYLVVLALYLLYAFTIGRRKYLLLGPDDTNPFSN